MSVCQNSAVSVCFQNGMELGILLVKRLGGEESKVAGEPLDPFSFLFLELNLP
jgi:hypothetical protein